ncbi:hypothetical protein F4808DRAFT_420320 [Astrocystis sublimbata]|nr:hypothetical protein F4808DRAFT_420320 [Astrocystis sublimbata]
MSIVSPTAAISHNSLRRPLSNLELFFESLSETGKSLNREHWTIHFALRLGFLSSVTDPISQLRRAWQILRFRHPALGAVIQESDPESNSKRASLFSEPVDIENWANDTFIVCRDYVDANQLFSCLYSTPTATCYWLPISSELVIRSSHWRIDGVGMAKLGHEFMTVLARSMALKVDAPLEGLLSGEATLDPGLSQSLEDLARAQSSYIRSTSHQGDPILAAAADELLGIFLRGVPSIGLPTRESTSAVPGPSERCYTQLSAEHTASIAAACREKGIKVTSAVHAAIVRVTARFPQHPLCKSYAAFVPVDLRRALEDTATSETKEVSKVVGLYFSGLPVCVDSVFEKSFEDIARDLAIVYARDLLDFWKPPGNAEHQYGDAIGMLDLVEPYVQRTTTLFNAPVPEGLPPVQTPDLSSLGKMESSIQREYEVESSDGGTVNDAKVKVLDFWVGTEMLTRNVQFHVWSWNQSLRLGVCYNTSFYEKTFVDDILTMVTRELTLGCGIDGDK